MDRPTRTNEKALAINLDMGRYGSFAEIGAGQEVARWFYRVGGAAGTIAKSVSAYDKTVSDAIYGPTRRYVVRERLEEMLRYEQSLTLERLFPQRGDSTAFFTFANTVQARSYQGNNECHGWIGVKFQSRPRDEDSQIILHVRMLDSENQAQQEALGIIGVNLLYGAFFLYHRPDELVESLLDELSIERIEIDMIEFSGIEFRHVDNRIMSLRLVQLGLTPAAMFSASGKVLQPSEVLRKRPVLLERGRFSPVTRVNLDMIDKARAQFAEDGGAAVQADDIVSVMEITMSNLRADQGEVDLTDFIGRAEVLGVTDHIVMISDYFEYYRLAAYLRRYTDRRCAIVMGAGALRQIFDERYYARLEGGILEALGRLFKNDLHIFVYPQKDPETGMLWTVETLEVPKDVRHLYGYLVERGFLIPVEDYDESVLDIQAPEVLEKLQSGDAAWEGMVDERVAEVIKARKLFGFGAR